MANLETWVVSLGIMTLFVIILSSVIIPELNTNNNQNYNITGLPTSSFQDRFESYQSDLNTKLLNGTASFTTLTTNIILINFNNCKNKLKFLCDKNTSFLLLSN